MEVQLTDLLRKTISKIEALEQEVSALKNELIGEFDYRLLQDCLTQKEQEIENINKLLLVFQTERNSLSQALRIVSSQGRVDPVQETQELEMVKEMNYDEKN